MHEKQLNEFLIQLILKFLKNGQQGIEKIIGNRLETNLKLSL
jgi:hypothetical protein